MKKIEVDDIVKVIKNSPQITSITFSMIPQTSELFERGFTYAVGATTGVCAIITLGIIIKKVIEFVIL